MSRSRRSPRYAALCDHLATARQDAGLTQTDLARRLARPQSYVSKYEAGERRLDVVEFTEVAEAIGCSPSEIVTALLAIKL